MRTSLPPAMLVLPQDITHAQAPASLQMLTAAMSAQPANAISLDCSPLTRFDSSALALLLGLNRAAQGKQKTLTLKGCPARLRQLASVYGVLELFQWDGEDAHPEGRLEG